MLSIDAKWAKPLKLLDGSKQQAIYRLADISKIPETPGAYVFARKHGVNWVPLYIGETENLRKRTEQNLNDVWLMKGIESSSSGRRLFLYCEVKTKKDQKLKKVLEVLQEALIEHAMSAGHQLLNTQLTKKKTHTITFKGNRASEKLAPRTMYVRGK